MKHMDKIKSRLLVLKDALNKNVNQLYGGSVNESNQPAMKTEVSVVPAAPSSGDSGSKKPKTMDSLDDHKSKSGKMSKLELKFLKNGQWKLEDVKKAQPERAESVEPASPMKGHSTFTMDHIAHVSAMKDHGAAKQAAHDVVDSSTAKPENKMKMKRMINTSKGVSHLAQGMANFMLAHPSEGLKTLGVNKAENPDKKADEELGEKVEHLVEEHMLDNEAAERKEGHKIMKKAVKAADPSDARMSQSYLKDAEKKIAELLSMIKPDQDLDDWVDAKITKAHEAISDVHTFLSNYDKK